MDGTSRVTGDGQARFREGLGVRFPGATRRSMAGFQVSCVKKNALLLERAAVPEMKAGPSEPASKSRLQTTVSCFGPMAEVVNVTEKA